MDQNPFYICNMFKTNFKLVDKTPEKQYLCLQIWKEFNSEQEKHISLSLSLSQSFKAQTSKIGRCSHTWAVGAGSPCQSEPAHMNTPPWMDGVWTRHLFVVGCSSPANFPVV